MRSAHSARRVLGRQTKEPSLCGPLWGRDRGPEQQRRLPRRPDARLLNLYLRGVQERSPLAGFSVPGRVDMRRMKLASGVEA